MKIKFHVSTNYGQFTAIRKVKKEDKEGYYVKFLGYDYFRVGKDEVIKKLR